jgi:hypothetical protein
VSDGPLLDLRDGAYVPNPNTRSPWSQELLHGGPVAALLAHETERLVAGDDALRLARLTVDLFRPVPYQPLTVDTELLRDGRRIKVVRASLSAEGVEVARAQALVLRADADAPPGSDVAPPSIEFPPQPDDREPEGPVAYANSIEWRHVTGWDAPGPAVAWLRVPMPLLPGVPMSPAVRAAAVSDFVNPLANIRGGAPYINADITLYLHRLPVGEWLGLAVAARGHEAGVAAADAALHDRTGPVGRCLVAALAQPRPAPGVGRPK